MIYIAHWNVPDAFTDQMEFEYMEVLHDAMKMRGFRDLYQQLLFAVPTITFRCREYRNVPKSVDTFVHARYMVRIPNGFRNWTAINLAKSEYYVFLGRKYNWWLLVLFELARLHPSPKDYRSCVFRIPEPVDQIGMELNVFSFVRRNEFNLMFRSLPLT